VVRLFVAAYPPAEWSARALALLDEVRLPPRARTTTVGALHLTIQFIGDASEKELPGVIESVERSAAGIGAFDLTPQRVITLPERGHARLIALELDCPPMLRQLHGRLVSRLARNPRGSEGARFVPHLTVCRFDPCPRPFVEMPIELPAFGIDEIRVMRSVLRPSGADHTMVRAYRLDAHGR